MVTAALSTRKSICSVNPPDRLIEESPILERPKAVPEVKETTVLGMIFVAGLSMGCWSDLEELRSLWRKEEILVPGMEEVERDRNWKGWKKAIEKSMGWVDEKYEADSIGIG